MRACVLSLAPQTGNSYLAAVRNMQISLGLPDPGEPRHSHSSEESMQELSRHAYKHNHNRKSICQLRPRFSQNKIALDKSTHPQKILLWAVACTAFFGFFRLGELRPESSSAFNPATSLTWEDVAIDNPNSPSMVKIHLKKAKCDQFGKGADIILGRTQKELCPVAALASSWFGGDTVPVRSSQITRARH